MARLDDLLLDMQVLDCRLDGVLVALDDPDSKMNGGDAAAIARERRTLGEVIGDLDGSFDRVGELRRDYDRLDVALGLCSGGAAAVIVRERRLASEVLDQLETREEVPLVDQLAARRQAKAGDSRPPARRRQSR